MLSKISWSAFIIFFAVVLGIYYVIIGIKYWRKEIFGFVNRITGKKTATPGIEAGSIKEKVPGKKQLKRKTMENK